jgi:hypothetical protein
MKYLLSLATLLVVFGCAKEKPAEEPQPTTTTAETTTTAAETQPPPAPQTAITIPAGAPIPADGVLLWLAADDVKSWESASVRPVHPNQLPALVPNTLNGHAVIRFDGTDQMLMSTVDIGPKRMPVGTVISVFRSATADASPLRKLYGDDNGSYDRAAGLDDRAAGKNYTLFTGIGVEGYLQLTANTAYIAVDEYSPKEFNGWINGAATLAKTPADWGEDALPNLYIGGTGTVYQEFWNGDLAEMIVYARKLSGAERTKVEDYLAQKYGVTLTGR